MVKLFETKNILIKYNLFWQYPVITEEEFYNQNKDDVNYCGLPWATFIDKGIHTNQLIHALLPYFTHKNYYTCCQHIYFRKIIPLLKILGIKRIYTPHKIKNEDFIHDVEILPCPLYAVNFEDNNRNSIFKNIDFLNFKRKYLFSFMGAYQEIYISDIRLDIFNLKCDSNETKIINTGEWHFNNIVYSSKQNKENEINSDKKHILNTEKYNELLLNSRYSLCPSGSGPNSIRFWESIACGSIPVILSDNLDLIKDIDWINTIVFVNEKEINNINKILKNIPVERENQLRKNCIKVYNILRSNYKSYQITDKNYIKDI